MNIYKNIKNIPKRRYTINTRKKILGYIDRSIGQKMDLMIPRRYPNSALPLHTQKQCDATGSYWGSSISVSGY